MSGGKRLEREMRKICFLDIEATGLEAESAFIVGFGLMDEKGEWKHRFASSVPSGEKELLSELMRELENYDLIITWYGEKFDLPMIYSRCLKHGLNPSSLLRKRHLDLHKIVSSYLKLSKNSLDNVCKFFDIKKEVTVTGADMPPYYMKALSGDKDALKLIEDHCKDDLNGLRQVYGKIRSFVDAVLEVEREASD